MVNCEHGPTPEPCGVCEQCVRIREGQHLDVVEIDAASHGGVDDARELRERAPTAPAMGREKVYILDEAQRLSREAFDALLKLFEEPPPAVRFVLATTEPHKMPATIVGRCQRFDFRRIGTDELAGLLERVAENEGWKLERSAAESLARQAEGSARDAESLLDQSAVLSAGAITDDTVATLVGAVQSDVQYELADAVAVGDARSVFQVVDRLVQNGQDLRHLTSEVLSHFRNLIIVQAAPDEPAALDVAPEEHARLAAQAAKFTTAELSRVVSLLLAAQADMRWTTSPRLSLELALVRATIPEADPASAGLAARIERLERLAGVSTGGSAGIVDVAPAVPEPVAADKPAAEEGAVDQSDARAPADTDAAPAKRTAKPPSPRKGASTAAAAESDSGSGEGASTAPGPDESVVAAGAAPHAPSTGALDLGAIRRSWPQLLERLKDQRQMILMANLESATAASWDGETLEISFPPGKKFGVEKVQGREPELQAAFVEVFGVSPRIRCLAREDVGDPLLGVDEDEHPVTAEDAIARLKAELGAEPEA
jgi:DNA polymerase-3 subunit gamma/tau